MLAPDLLECLRCPHTGQRLNLADSGLLEEINSLIHSGRCLNAGGESPSAPLSEALVNEDRSHAYPVRDQIPVLLPDEALLLPKS